MKITIREYGSIHTYTEYIEPHGSMFGEQAELFTPLYDYWRPSRLSFHRGWLAGYLSGREWSARELQESGIQVTDSAAFLQGTVDGSRGELFRLQSSTLYGAW